jgi:hypothetical protein
VWPGLASLPVLALSSLVLQVRDRSPQRGYHVGGSSGDGLGSVTWTWSESFGVLTPDSTGNVEDDGLVPVVVRGPRSVFLTDSGGGAGVVVQSLRTVSSTDSGGGAGDAVPGPGSCPKVTCRALVVGCSSARGFAGHP